jgi:hypothetical protein
MAPATKTEPTPIQPVQEQIATLAYALWQQRGCPEGSPDVDWFQAEVELIGRETSPE